MKRWRILLADDHKVVLQGLQRILEGPEFEIVGAVEDGRGLIAAAEEMRPDVIVTDFSMPVLNGLEASRQILRQNPKAKILMLSVHRDAPFAVEARNAGVRGYVIKNAEPPELVHAIREVLEGKIYIDPSIAESVANSTRPHRNTSRTGAHGLTQRQREVLQLLAEGKQPKEIAAMLGISIRTVEFHKYRIMETLALRTVPELAVYAAKKGIVG
jgi:DNA-binding NarL/FixJ family response regulator